jgi:hypothetical protein
MDDLPRELLELLTSNLQSRKCQHQSSYILTRVIMTFSPSLTYLYWHFSFFTLTTRMIRSGSIRMYSSPRLFMSTPSISLHTVGTCKYNLFKSRNSKMSLVRRIQYSCSYNNSKEVRFGGYRYESLYSILVNINNCINCRCQNSPKMSQICQFWQKFTIVISRRISIDSFKLFKWIDWTWNFRDVRIYT